VAGAPALEHDPEKWMPVFGKDHAPTKNLDHDPIQSNWIMVQVSDYPPMAAVKVSK
jgi:hypothetical protein